MSERSIAEYQDASLRVACRQNRRTCPLCGWCANGPTWEHIRARLNMHMHDKHGEQR